MPTYTDRKNNTSKRTDSQYVQMEKERIILPGAAGSW